MVDKSLKQIGDEVADGTFLDLLELLKKKDVTKKQAIYFIVCCCTTCNSNINTPDRINVKDLMTSVQILAKKIEDVSSQEFDGYLQSIYFIFKFLLKKNYELVLQLENELLPSFLPNILSDKQKEIYKSMCQLAKNDLINMIRANTVTNANSWISIGHLLSRILLKTSNTSVFMEIIFGFGLCLANADISKDVDCDFFLSNLKLIELSTLRSKEILCMINYAMVIFTRYLREGMLKESQNFLTKVFDMISDIKNSLHIKVLIICRYMINADTNLDELTNYKELLSRLMKKYGDEESFRYVCRAIASAISNYAVFCTEFEKFFANVDLSPTYYQIFDKIMAFLTYNAPSCIGKCECSTNGVLEGAGIAVATAKFFFIHLTNHDVCIDSFKIVMSYFEKYVKFLVSLKKNQCEKWERYWIELHCHIHNTAVMVFRKEKYEEPLLIGRFVLKYHAILGTSKSNDTLLNALSYITCSYSKQKKYTEALLWTTVEILNSEESARSKNLFKFVKIKVAARDGNASPEIQEQTTLSILKKMPKEYECYLKDLKNDRNKQIQLLISELETYVLRWKSKLAMMAALRDLSKIADNSTLMRIFVKIFCTWDLPLHKQSEEILGNVLNEYEASNSHHLMVFVHYFRYKIVLENIFSKNLDEMNKIVETKKAPNHVVDNDPNDQCDVVSVYDGLFINSEKLENLKKCLVELERTVQSKYEVDFERLYSLAKHVAVEYILHSDLSNFLRASYSALKIAKYLKNNDYILECTGYLIKYTCNTNLGNKLSNIEKQQPDNEYLIQYYVDYSYGFLRLDEKKKAFVYFSKAVDCLRRLKNESKDVQWNLEVEVELLTFEVMRIMGNDVEFGIKFSYRPLLKAYDIILEKYSIEPEWCRNFFVIFCKVFETLIRTYHDLKMPREVRCFGKQFLKVAQVHSLPIESSKALKYLAHADYRCGRLDDFRVKVDGISRILQLENVRKYDLQPIEEKKIVPSINVITDGLREIMLDANPNDRQVKLSPSSPTYIGETYQQPQFSYHENCECFQCTSTEYHELVVSRYYLEALWYMHLKQVTLANSFFRGTLNLSEILTMKKSIFPKNLKDITQDIDVKHHSIARCRYNCSVDYVKFLYTCGTSEAAEKYNNELIKTMEIDKQIHTNVYAEALLQKLRFMHKNKQSKTNAPTELTLPECKTPEKSARKILKLNGYSPKTRTFLPPKVIKFNLASLDEDSKKTPCKKPMSLRTPSKTPRNKLIPPSLRTTKTPLLKTPTVTKISTSNQSVVKNESNTDNISPLSEISDPSNTANDKKTEKNILIKGSLVDIGVEKLAKTRRMKEVASSSKKSTAPKKLNLNKAMIEDDDSSTIRRSRRNRT